MANSPLFVNKVWASTLRMIFCTGWCGTTLLELGPVQHFRFPAANVATVVLTQISFLETKRVLCTISHCHTAVMTNIDAKSKIDVHVRRRTESQHSCLKQLQRS